MRENDLPPPEWRLPTQHFVFLLYESPVHTDLELLRRPIFTNYFNTTMTYRRDSDIVDLHPYGRINCIDPSSSSCLDFPLGNGTAVQEISPSRTVFSALPNLKNKKRSIAWFVSNCNTNSRRESMVKKLANFISVDIYGKCSNGNSSCPNVAECDDILSRHYRFYLSFENSLCPDYATEKLYRPLAHDTVPVVYGGFDYSFYLPPGSYINAMDYKSPEELANYLKKLMTDDGLYLTYFQWRGKYQVSQSPLDGWCHLCRLLMDPLAKKKNKSYVNMAEWWSGQTINRTCLSPPQSLVI